MKAAGEEEVLLLQPGLRDLELHRALRLVLHDDGARRHLVSMTHVPNLQSDEVASAQLAVDAQVEGTRASIWRRTRSAQMSLSWNGAFCPTILPLFHGSRSAALPAVPMMVSIELRAAQDALSPRQAAICRPTTGVGIGSG